MSKIELWQSILSNTAIIFFMHLLISTLFQYKQSVSKKTIDTLYVLIISAAVIIMFYLPIQYGEYRLDLRLIPLVFAAYRKGWGTVLSTLFITTSWRYFLGGDGAIPGIIFGMIFPVILVHLISLKKKSKENHFTYFAIFTLSWIISDLPIIFIVPDGWSVFLEISPLRYVSIIINSMFLYIFINQSVRQEELVEQLQFYAERDPLTGLFNRRTFINKLHEYSERADQPYLAIIDIDYFKKINDRYGHVIGDKILKKVARVIDKDTVKNKIAARYGGEEFILFFPSIERNQLIQFLEEIRRDVEETTFTCSQGNPISGLTISIGAAPLDLESDYYQSIDRADQNLYTAKRNGRNQIYVGDE